MSSVIPRRAPAGLRHAGEEADEYAVSELVRAFESPPTSAAAIHLYEAAADLTNRHFYGGRRGLVVCGPSRGVGVTFVTTNLSVALARNGAKVLLVDGNLHEPGVDALIRPSRPAPGLRDLLADESLGLDDVVRREVAPGLSILYSGGPASGASELIGGARCAAVVDECLREFDVTIFDTPPANRSPDARRLAGLVGYAVIIGRRDVTYVDDVATLVSELTDDGAQVVGTLFNRG